MDEGVEGMDTKRRPANESRVVRHLINIRKVHGNCTTDSASASGHFEIAIYYTCQTKDELNETMMMASTVCVSSYPSSPRRP